VKRRAQAGCQQNQQKDRVASADPEFGVGSQAWLGYSHALTFFPTRWTVATHAQEMNANIVSLGNEGGLGSDADPREKTSL